MAYHDSNPERRNLVVTALAFIVYFWGGGRVISESLKISLVSIEFENQIVLALLAWVALFWFLYRYWLTHAGDFSKAFKKEICNLEYIRDAEKYLSNALDISFSPDSSEGYHLQYMEWKLDGLYASYCYAQKVRRNPETRRVAGRTGLNPEKSAEYKFSGFRDWATAIRITSRCFFSNPSFSNYLVPYLLFITVLATGIMSVAL